MEDARSLLSGGGAVDRCSTVGRPLLTETARRGILARGGLLLLGGGRPLAAAEGKEELRMKVFPHTVKGLDELKDA